MAPKSGTFCVVILTLLLSSNLAFALARNPVTSLRSPFPSTFAIRPPGRRPPPHGEGAPDGCLLRCRQSADILLFKRLPLFREPGRPSPRLDVYLPHSG